MEYAEVIIHKKEETIAKRRPNPVTSSFIEREGVISAITQQILLLPVITGTIDIIIINFIMAAVNVHASLILSVLDDIRRRGRDSEISIAKKGFIEIISIVFKLLCQV